MKIFYEYETPKWRLISPFCLCENVWNDIINMILKTKYDSMILTRLKMWRAVFLLNEEQLIQIRVAHCKYISITIIDLMHKIGDESSSLWSIKITY